MQSWLTLLGAIAGATIALLGQHTVRRGEERRRSAELLLEQSAQVAALAEDFNDRVWQESVLGLTGKVEGWDLRAERLAVARLTILSADRRLTAALDELYTAGDALGTAWRAGGADPDDLEAHRLRYKAARAEFISASGEIVRGRLSR